MKRQSSLFVALAAGIHFVVIFTTYLGTLADLWIYCLIILAAGILLSLGIYFYFKWYRSQQQILRQQRLEFKARQSPSLSGENCYRKRPQPENRRSQRHPISWILILLMISRKMIFGTLRILRILHPPIPFPTRRKIYKKIKHVMLLARQNMRRRYNSSFTSYTVFFMQTHIHIL